MANLGRVCPRCGEPAGKDEFCSKCGLNLWEQPELPTREEWEQAQSEEKPGPPSAKAGTGTPVAHWWRSLSSSRQEGVLISAAIVGIVVVVVVVAIAANSGGGSSIGSGDGGAPSGYATPSQATSAISGAIEQTYGGNIESASCDFFDPSPPPVYECQYKVDGEWHDNIQATGHPDGSLTWEDDTSVYDAFSGGQVSAK